MKARPAARRGPESDDQGTQTGAGSVGAEEKTAGGTEGIMDLFPHWRPVEKYIIGREISPSSSSIFPREGHPGDTGASQ